MPSKPAPVVRPDSFSDLEDEVKALLKNKGQETKSFETFARLYLRFLALKGGKALTPDGSLAFNVLTDLVKPVMRKKRDPGAEALQNERRLWSFV